MSNKRFMNEKAVALWEFMVSEEIATNEELELCTSLNGCTLETLENVLMIRTDCTDFWDYLEKRYNPLHITFEVIAFPKGGITIE